MQVRSNYLVECQRQTQQRDAMLKRVLKSQRIPPYALEATDNKSHSDKREGVTENNVVLRHRVKR